MINIELLDRFLCLPPKIRYSILSGAFILLWFISYFLFIMPIKEQLQRALFAEESIQHDIELITQKIASYPSFELLSAQMVDLSEIAKKNHLSTHEQLNQISLLLLSSPLKLIDFDNQSTFNQWQFILQGDYVDFVQFFDQLTQLNLPYHLCELSIHKQKDYLKFILCLQQDTHNEERQ